MNLNQLFETAGETVAIIFGRFNPPHKGHRAAWEMASKYPVWYVGTNQSTQGPKDPLPYDVKVEAMKTIWPEVEGHIVADTSWLTLASNAFEAHPNASTLLCLTDEDWVTKTIQQYNGKQGAHGFYNFKEIKQQPTPRLSSATALRDAVAAGDRDAFSQAAGVSADTPVDGKSFFDLVADYLLPYANAPKKSAKPKAAPVEEPVAEGNEMSDAAQARELIGRALRSPQERDKYFDFIKFLIRKNGKDYGVRVHQLATKLAKEGQDGMAGVGMGNYVVDRSTTNEGSSTEFQDKLRSSVPKGKGKNTNFQNIVARSEKKDPHCPSCGLHASDEAKGGKHGKFCTQTNEGTEVEESKQRLDPKCWKGYKKSGTKIKGDTRVNNCVPVDESIEDIMSKAIALLETKNK